MVWNCLPSDCKKANSFQSFKMKLKTVLVEQYNLYDLFVCLFFFSFNFIPILCCNDF